MDPLDFHLIPLPIPLLPDCHPSPVTAAIMSAFMFPASYVPTVDLSAYPCATPLRSFDPDFVASLVSSTTAPDAPLFPIIVTYVEDAIFLAKVALKLTTFLTD